MIFTQLNLFCQESNTTDFLFQKRLSKIKNLTEFLQQHKTEKVFKIDSLRNIEKDPFYNEVMLTFFNAKSLKEKLAKADDEEKDALIYTSCFQKLLINYYDMQCDIDSVPDFYLVKDTINNTIEKEIEEKYGYVLGKLKNKKEDILIMMFYFSPGSDQLEGINYNSFSDYGTLNTARAFYDRAKKNNIPVELSYLLYPEQKY